MDNTQYYAQGSKSQGASAYWAPAPSAEATPAYQYPSEQNPNNYDEATRNYYQQYYNAYYSNSTDPNYAYQNTQQGSFAYPQDAKTQAQGPSIPPGGYQPGHDYSSWYQQPGYNYSYNGVTYPSSYPYSNNYAAYTTPAEQQKKAEPTGSSATPPKQAHFAPQKQVSFPPPPPPIFPPPQIGSGPSVLSSQPPKIIYGMKNNPKPSSSKRASNDYTKSGKKTTHDIFEKSGHIKPGFTISGESSKAPHNPIIITVPTVPVTLPVAPAVAPVMPTPSNSNTDAELVERLLQDTFEEVRKVSSSLEIRDGVPVCPVGLREFFTRMYSKHPLIKTGREYEQAVIDLVVNAAANGRLHRSNWLVHPAPSILKQSRATAASENGSASTMSSNIRISTVPEASNTEINRRGSEISSEFYSKRKDPKENVRLLERLKRFKMADPAPQHGKRVMQAPTEQNRADVIDWDDATIIGTCLKHEKSYFRLTSEVNPALVRPLYILEEWSEKLMEKYAKDKDYRYFLDQFQSIRQDLTVQRIKNPFAIRTYETVARVALEMGDLGEFNKCQTILKEFYSYGIQGNECEFIAYRILYFMHTRSQSDINKTLTALSQEQKSHDAIKHALQLRSASSSLNYVLFFKLYRNSPNLGKYLIDNFLERERVRALTIICSSFRQTISVEYVSSHLGFDNILDCFDFLKRFDVITESTMSDSNGHPIDFNTRLALSKAQAAYNKFSKVDLKGQIN